MSTLTPGQKKVLDYIASVQRVKGYCPSQAEIARHFKFKSLGTVQDYFRYLQDKGYLERAWNSKRSIRLSVPHQSLASHTIPLLGRVAAGRPIEHFGDQGEEKTIAIPPTFERPLTLYALEVVGDSMIDEGICEGDHLVIRAQATARNGQTVIAMVRNEATVKTFFRHKDHVELHPANSKYKPIFVREGADLAIQGIVVGLIRNYAQA